MLNDYFSNALVAFDNFKNKNSMQLYKEGKELSDLSKYSINIFVKNANQLYEDCSKESARNNIKKLVNQLEKNEDGILKDFYLGKNKIFHKFINNNEMEKFINSYLLNLFQLKTNYHDMINLKHEITDEKELMSFCVEKMNNERYFNFSIHHVPNEIVSDFIFHKLMVENVEMARMAVENYDSPDSNRFLRICGKKAEHFLDKSEVAFAMNKLRSGELSSVPEYNMELIELMYKILKEGYLRKKLENFTEEYKVKKERPKI